MTASPRHKRKTFVGFVTSRMGDKSVKVTVPYRTPHPRYQKVIKRQTVVHAHDEKNESRVGDKVEVMETRPISRLKRWRVVRVVEAARSAADHGMSENDIARTFSAQPATAPDATSVPEDTQPAGNPQS